jgi:hypothetical protein
MTSFYPRILRTIPGFNEDITNTNNYIMLPSEPPPGNTNGLRIGWLQDEINQWQIFLTQWQAYYVLYTNKRGSRTSEVIDQLNQIIKDTVKFEQEHHLYDRIAISTNAVMLDFETFRLKRFTPLADTTPTHAEAPGTKIVVITIKQTGHLFHELLVISPNVEGRGKEEGVDEILVFVAYTDAGEMTVIPDRFQYYGDVKNGLITVVHHPENEGRKAWFMARVKNTRGEIGLPSTSESGIII